MNTFRRQTLLIPTLRQQILQRLLKRLQGKGELSAAPGTMLSAVPHVLQMIEEPNETPGRVGVGFPFSEGMALLAVTSQDALTRSLGTDTIANVCRGREIFFCYKTASHHYRKR